MRSGALLVLVASVALGAATDAAAQCGKLGTFNGYPLDS